MPNVVGVILPCWQRQDQLLLDQGYPDPCSGCLDLLRNRCRGYGRCVVRQCHDGTQRRTTTSGGKIAVYERQFFPKLREVLVVTLAHVGNESDPTSSIVLQMKVFSDIPLSDVSTPFVFPYSKAPVLTRLGNLRRLEQLLDMLQRRTLVGLHEQ